MSGRSWRGTAVGTAVVALAWAAGASAASDQITVSNATGGTDLSFAADEFALDAGTVPTFVNSDPEGTHNVAATADGPGGDRLFETALLPGGESAPVEGAQYLTPGAYSFVCTIHDGMDATLVVSGPGALPRPSVEAAVVSSKLRRVQRGKLKVAVEAATDSTGVSLAARVGGRFAGSASGIDIAARQRRTIALKLSRRTRESLAGLDRATVKLTAVVPQGEPASAKRTLR